MELFVVEYGDGYEWRDILGVNSTLELAKKRASDMEPGKAFRWVEEKGGLMQSLNVGECAPLNVYFITRLDLDGVTSG